jgi:hypothetical protein
VKPEKEISGFELLVRDLTQVEITSIIDRMIILRQDQCD